MTIMTVEAEAHDPPLPFKDLLAAVNGVLLAAVILLVAGHHQRRDNKRSWAFAFHLLCLAWLAFRQAFWVLCLTTTAPWDAGTFYLVYWLPHPLQFAMFLLLPLFYAQVLSVLGRWHAWIGTGRAMEARWRFVRNVYVALNVCMVVYMMGCVVAAGSMEREQFRCLNLNERWRDKKEAREHAKEAALSEQGQGNGARAAGWGGADGEGAASFRRDDPWQDDDADDDGEAAREVCFGIALSTGPVRWLTAWCFLFLAVVLLAYGVKVSNLSLQEAQRFLIGDPKALGLVNGVLFGLFLSRGVYEVGTIYGLWYLPDLPLNKDRDLDPRSFACMALWDYLPLVLLLASVSTAASGRFAQKTGSFVRVRPADRSREGSLGEDPAHGGGSAHGGAQAGESGHLLGGAAAGEGPQAGGGRDTSGGRGGVAIVGYGSTLAAALGVGGRPPQLPLQHQQQGGNSHDGATSTGSGGKGPGLLGLSGAAGASPLGAPGWSAQAATFHQWQRQPTPLLYAHTKAQQAQQAQAQQAAVGQQHSRAAVVGDGGGGGVHGAVAGNLSGALLSSGGARPHAAASPLAPPQPSPGPPAPSLVPSLVPASPSRAGGPSSASASSRSPKRGAYTASEGWLPPSTYTGRVPVRESSAHLQASAMERSSSSSSSSSSLSGGAGQQPRSRGGDRAVGAGEAGGRSLESPPELARLVAPESSDSARESEEESPPGDGESGKCPPPRW